MTKRLDSLQAVLLNDTVLNDWFLPMQKALDKVRYSRQRFSTLSADFFKRGVTTRACNEGGGQERALADFYRHQAQALAGSHVYLAAALEQLARWYENDGQREDISARLGRENY